MGEVLLIQVLPGDLTTDEVRAWFSDAARSDSEASEAFGADSYRATWATMHGVKVMPSTPAFSTREYAQDFLAGDLSKWGSARAVRFHENEKTLWLIAGMVSE